VIDHNIGRAAMADARTNIDETSLEGVVANWFYKRGMMVSRVEINPVGDNGDWEIDQAAAGPDYGGLAREAEGDLRSRFRLVQFEVRRLETPPPGTEPIQIRRKFRRSIGNAKPKSKPM